ncbi:MAG TPA: hypothetical protein VJP06_07170 [Thermoplasmata archaeon]|nr:hypothetical protein [Thermoplasmata archaeon]
MRTRSLGLIVVAAVIAVVAVAAVAFGPMNLTGLTNRTPTSDKPGPGGPGPQTASPIPAPTWQVGDTWTYNTSRPDPVLTPQWGAPSSQVGSITRTVTSASNGVYNVSITGSFHIPDLIDPTTDTPANAIILSRPTALENASVEGYAWYRMSDLAKLKDFRLVTVSGPLWTEAGVANASFSATVETTYSPALDLWSFPLGENESWNASSNATIHASLSWHAAGPNWTWNINWNFNATVPVKLVLTSGTAENVTTPAGTFRAIPVRVHLAMPGPMDDHKEMAMNLGNDEAIEHRAPAELWFSGTVKGVVQATMTIRGVRVEAVLISYHVA